MPEAPLVDRKPPGHPALPGRKTGVLLLNLGTPNGTDYWSMRRYLGEFLSDRRIIELPKALWQPILQGVILTVRPGRSGKAYAKIWNEELNESPLRTYTRRATEGVAALLAETHPQLKVDYAMRYGDPSTASRVRGMVEAGCDRLLLVPLYPQYSAATTATACDQAFRQLMQERWQPAVRTAPPWYDDPEHIDLLARSVERRYAELDWTPDVLICSFHGLPKENLEKGDPYYCHCSVTARLLRERLGWSEDRLVMAFQSRFGPKEWLQPYADETVRGLPAKGARNVAMISPGFVADCVETLEELAIGLEEEFHAAGGENFAYVPCLNDEPGQLAFLARLIERELAGWLEAAAVTDALAVLAELGPFDWLGIALLVLGWPVYDFFADSYRLDLPDFTRSISKFRMEWMRRAALRRNRIADANLIGVLTRTVGLFASTTVLILAGVMTLLGASETGWELTQALPFAADTSLVLWQAKAFFIALLFVYAFVTLIWSLWQWNACAVVLGAAPLDDEDAADDYGARAGELADAAGIHFNKALRAYTYALALAAWFIRPELFVAAVAAVLWLQYRRDFRSHTFRILNRPRPAKDARDPERP